MMCNNMVHEQDAAKRESGPAGLNSIAGRNAMPLPLDKIHEIEVREDYPAAIDALEARLQADPSEKETVIRLGFNLWYAAHEEARLRKGLPTERYGRRFMDLFREYRAELQDDADVCWAFGLGISLFWHEFPGADEPLGKALLARAKSLDCFYCRMKQEEMSVRFRGRGIFASYYATAQPSAAPNGSPAAPGGDSGVTEGPPSVS